MQSKPQQKGTIIMLKILSIGNSFSCDAQRYLHAIAKAQGVDLLCCNLYIGGCSLAHHWDCFVNEKPEYGWYVNGEEIANGYTVSRGLAADDWDVITLQQVSHDTGTEIV